VMIGRVKVVIQHLNGLPNYNKVSSPTAVISVRGTIFDVVVEDEEGTTLVSVDEGLVGVLNTTAPGNGVLVNPGESIRVYRNQPLALRQIDKGRPLARRSGRRKTSWSGSVGQESGRGGAAGRRNHRSRVPHREWRPWEGGATAPLRPALLVRPPPEPPPPARPARPALLPVSEAFLIPQEHAAPDDPPKRDRPFRSC